jgi:hypothetical protein
MKKQISKKGLFKEILKKFNRKGKEEEIMKKISKISLVCLAVLSLIVVGGVFARDYDLVNEYRREIRLSNERASTQRSITGDTRTAEYETGKTITDVNGYRVEMAPYIEKGYSLQTFNKDLPDNLGDLYGKMSGIGQAPEYYATDIETRVSNPEGDSWQHDSEGGFLHEYATNGSCRVLYEVEKTSVNDIPKIKVERKDYDFHREGNQTWSVPNRQGELAILYNGQTGHLDLAILPALDIHISGSEAHWSGKLIFVDGTFISHEHYRINDKGEPLTWRKLFGEGLTIENWQEEISQWNNEHILGASEFNGRNIDIVWSPHSLALEVFRTDIIPEDN